MDIDEGLIRHWGMLVEDDHGDMRERSDWAQVTKNRDEVARRSGGFVEYARKNPNFVHDMLQLFGYLAWSRNLDEGGLRGLMGEIDDMAERKAAQGIAFTDEEKDMCVRLVDWLKSTYRLSKRTTEWAGPEDSGDDVYESEEVR